MTRSYKVISVDDDTILLDESIFPWGKKKYRSYKIFHEGEDRIEAGVYYLQHLYDKMFLRIHSRHDRCLAKKSS